ncbi:MAG: hypothetical protein PHW04_13790 [Candidatus Wallbacteria bacterium]|nr:hypothetical protein [Candidatus Wallbacteria bacterium]
MRRIDPKRVEQTRDLQRERVEKFMDDPLYETIDLLAQEIKGKTVEVSNSRNPADRKKVHIDSVTTTYVPGNSLTNKFIKLIDNGVEVMKFDIPTDIKVKGNRFTLDYSEKNMDKVIMKSFKLKGSDYLEVYLDVI